MTCLLGGTIRTLLLATALMFFWNISTHADDAASVYKAKCAVCHAPDGSGQSVMGRKLGAKDLRSDEVQRKSDAELNDLITNGVGKTMPAYKDKLTAEQIKGLVAYIREIAKNK